MLSVERLDAKARTIWFTASGKEKGRDPYFRHLYRIGMDGKGLTLLTPEDCDHNISLSPDGARFVDSWSRPDLPQTAVLRDARTGKLIATLETGDISKLTATGWKPPTRITVKSRDGKWDLYGLLWTPTKLDSTRKYPIINYIYPGPQGGSVGSRQFTPATRDNQALAELGFIVVSIDGTGNPMRSKSFHDAYYGRMGDNTLPDQIAGMKELASRYRFIDLDRVGIWGHSGGGFATAGAMFRYPDFFKVGIAESGNHDNRNYEDDWGERYHGLLTRNGGTDNYDAEANQTLAKNLKGKLMLAHGTLDDNVPPDNTLLVVDAHQGRQGLRPHHDSQCGPWLRRRVELHDAPSLGLFRAAPHGCRAPQGTPDRAEVTTGVTERTIETRGGSSSMIRPVVHPSTDFDFHQRYGRIPAEALGTV